MMPGPPPSRYLLTPRLASVAALLAPAPALSSCAGFLAPSGARNVRDLPARPAVGQLRPPYCAGMGPSHLPAARRGPTGGRLLTCVPLLRSESLANASNPGCRTLPPGRLATRVSCYVNDNSAELRSCNSASPSRWHQLLDPANRTAPIAATTPIPTALSSSAVRCFAAAIVMASISSCASTS